MCNLGEGVWRSGLEQGLEQGQEITMLKAIRNLMDSLRMTAVQAMDALKIPEAEQGKYLAMLNA